MNLCILSGKGGTGKTTVSTNLALLTGSNYIDCDVEEPNGFIFLRPSEVSSTDVTVDYPVIEPEKCTLCKKCSDICQFNALVTTKKSVMVFDKLCHSCGACKLVCEPGALGYKPRQIGKVEKGTSKNITAKRGLLNVGEHMGVPLIKELLESLPSGDNILDCPPGTSCNVVNTIEHADKALLVTEPTVFGLHDLSLAVSLLQSRNIPFGVVINKYDGKNSLIEDFCSETGIPIIGTISYSRQAAEVYSRGGMLTDIPKAKAEFERIASGIREVI